MHKNKYDHNILLNDIQKLDKIQHKHSLVAIQFPDTSAEKKYLVYYDERWDCKLFCKRLNFRHGYKNPRPHFCNRSTLIIHI